MPENQKILFSPPNVDDLDTEEVIRALKSGWVAPVGPQLEEFSGILQSRFNIPHVVLMNSGTSALHIALKLAGIGSGDHVVVGTFSFIAAANVVLYERAVPVFVDSEDSTWNLDPDLLEEYLNKKRGKPDFPKAVIVTHVYGIPAKIIRIKEICGEHGVKLIEDAAEALGSTIEDEQLGCVGDYGVLSFNGNKIITTSGGGALICKTELDQSKARKWITQSKSFTHAYEHDQIGYNYALSNILAGLGIGQLKKIDHFLKVKSEINAYYRDQLSGVKWIDFPAEIEGSNHWVNPIKIKSEFLKYISPEHVIEHLEHVNIEARKLFMPLHMQSFLSGYESFGREVSEGLYQSGVCLPSGTSLEVKDLDRIVKALKDLLF